MKVVKIFLIISSVLLSFKNASADNDPLNKPKVWSMLQESPSDPSLWAAYVGKSWACMTINEKDKVATWKTYLKENRKEVVAKVGNSSVNLTEDQQKKIKEEVFHESDDFWEGEVLQSQIKVDEALREEVELKEHFEQMEQRMVATPSVITILSRNLRENFILIDDEFRMEFESLGLEYVGYWDTYPNGKYSPERWVYERNVELKAKKKIEFEKIKMSMLASVASSKDGN
ncbi:hypothetical protein [Flammeovirga kamogawensis]|uniref:Uncharacterized protein n=1 Tax=Flammeovirga kamogawensis TaxID=373891 RepID=A0ABX8GSE2_9BACT|nr:hypothetical protein [Flammeovirga kamogawensis]MBB6462902.1 hypothetical protein [Flammeovirga kamogawensis]QWG06431.1 hypothetical protein KM029_13970 [Flammeovirga kamogawensis]TRX68262.1 hypothetical protein EO216_08985 [Flammeovirga kamogawensis]